MEVLPEDFFDDEFDEPKKRPVWHLVGAFLAIVGLIYLSGVYQTLFLRRTPTSAVQPQLGENAKEVPLVVPVRVLLFTGDSDHASTRDLASVRSLLTNTGVIWNQASISFAEESIVEINLDDVDVREFLRRPQVFIQNLQGYNPEVINLVLTRTLPAINGIAFTGIRATAVADFTSTNDFRTLAHEIGHILGLGHTVNKSRLMSQGVNGTDLTEEEIKTARERALTYDR